MILIVLEFKINSGKRLKISIRIDTGETMDINNNNSWTSFINNHSQKFLSQHKQVYCFVELITSQHQSPLQSSPSQHKPAVYQSNPPQMDSSQFEFPKQPEMDDSQSLEALGHTSKTDNVNNSGSLDDLNYSAQNR